MSEAVAPSDSIVTSGTQGTTAGTDECRQGSAVYGSPVTVTTVLMEDPGLKKSRVMPS